MLENISKYMYLKFCDNYIIFKGNIIYMSY